MEKNHSEGREPVLSAVLPVYLVLVIVSVLFFLRRGDDLHFHMQRLGAIMEEFQHSGISALPIRLYHATAYGYGYASPLFYGDVFMWPFAALAVWLKLPVLTAYKLMLAVTAVGIWLMARLSFGLILRGRERDIAVFLYMCSVTIFDDMTGSWVGRDFAALFVPLCFCSFFGLLYGEDEWKYGVLLALGVTGTIYSNMLDAAIVVFSLLFVFLFTLSRMSVKKFLLLSAAVLLCLGLSAWFLFPLAEQMASQTFFVSGETVRGLNDLHKRTMPLIGLLFPYRISSILYEALGLKFDFRPEYFYGMVFYLGLADILFRKRRTVFPAEDEKRPFYLSATVLMLLYMLFQTRLFPHGLFAWLLNTMQFPWRVNIVMACIGCLLAAKIWETTEDPALIRSLVSLTVVVMLINVMSIYGTEIGADAERRTLYANSYTSASVGYGEYLPEELLEGGSDVYIWKKRLQDRGTSVLCDDGQAEYELIKDFDAVTVSYSRSGGTAGFELPLLYYKGYSAVDCDSGEAITVEKSENGLVRVLTAKGAGSFRVFYGGTALQRISEWCSIVTALILFVCVCIKKKSHRRVIP